MNIEKGIGNSELGPGIAIQLTGDEVASAIESYLVAHNVYVNGPRTITVNNELCKFGFIYVDPMGNVIHNGQRHSGRTGDIE